MLLNILLQQYPPLSYTCRFLYSKKKSYTQFEISVYIDLMAVKMTKDAVTVLKGFRLKLKM